MAETTGTFKHSLTIDQPVDVVWRALTTKADVDKYYLAPLGADITSGVSEIYYGTPDNHMIVGKVVTLRPAAEFAHTFMFTGRDNPPESLATYRLTPTEDGTLLELEHTGFVADSQEYADISMGWPIILEGLKAHVEGAGAQ